MLKRTIRIAWALAWAVLFCPCVAMYAQVDGSPGGDAAQDEAGTVSSGKEVQAPRKDAAASVEVKKTGKREETPEPARAEGEGKAQQLNGAGGLIEITDGDFLYRRIPDKKFPQAPSPAGDAFLSDSPVNSEENPDLSQRKGLFGLSARATDYLAKGFLVFIILMIVILYRMRSRSRRSTVHKSFR